MKKLIFGIAALFMMSVVLVGCDNKKSKKDKDDEDEDERTEQKAELDDEEEYEEEEIATFSVAPEDKLVDLLEDAVRIMKRAHIRTQDDVTALAEKMSPVKDKVEQTMKELMEAYKDKDPKELEEMGKILEEKMQKISEDAKREGDRLEKEAEEAGVDLSELESLDIL